MKTGLIPIIIILSMLMTITGCITLDYQQASLVLTNYTHEESLEHGNQSISGVSFIISNEGVDTAEDIQLNIIAYDQDQNIQYENIITDVDPLEPDKNTTEAISIPYDEQDIFLKINLSIIWDDQLIEEKITYAVENFSADVQLINFSHDESITIDELLVSTLNFTVENLGEVTARNVTLDVEVYDQLGNIQYDDEQLLAVALLYEQQISKEIIVNYELGDISLDVQFTIRWNGGIRQYSRVAELTLIS